MSQDCIRVRLNSSHSSVVTTHFRNVSINTDSEIEPRMDRSTNMPSGSPSGATNEYPFSLKNTEAAAIAVRLLPCSNG
jgi:hypothetical protein